MTFTYTHLDKTLIDMEGNLRLPKEKYDALRRLSSLKGRGLGEIHDVPSYIAAVLKIYDVGQREEIEKLLKRYLDEGFKENEKDNLTPLLYGFDFEKEQTLVFLDLLKTLSICEERGLIAKFRDRIEL